MDFPLMGVIPINRRLTRQGYRILIVDNYLVFYVLLDNETVEIKIKRNKGAGLNEGCLDTVLLLTFFLFI